MNFVTQRFGALLVTHCWAVDRRTGSISGAMTQNLGNRPSNSGRPESMPSAFPDELDELIRCTRCKLPYQAVKSTSGLRLTYCSFLCELGDLGFSMAGLEHMERDIKPEPDSAEEPETKPQELSEPTSAE